MIFNFVNIDPTRKKQLSLVLIILGIILIAGIIYSIYISIQRSGKVLVEILTIPPDASVVIDEAKSSNKAYLTEGYHDFVISSDGFSEHKGSHYVSEKVNKVVVSLTPKTDEARKKVADYGKSLGSENALGDVHAYMRSSFLRETNPVINILPKTDLTGPYKIEYKFYPGDPDKVYVTISYATPKGRQNALKYLTDNGIDITTTDIKFTNFDNPLTREVN